MEVYSSMKKSIADIKEIKENTKKSIDQTDKIRITVGMATCGLAAGAGAVYDAIKEEIEKLNLKNVELIKTGCIGICQFEPIVEVMIPNQVKATYVKVDSDKACAIVKDDIANGEIKNTNWLYEGTYVDGKLIPIEQTAFYKRQLRIALHNCGVINPENIDEYIGRQGYEALGKVLTKMKPNEVIDLIKDAGLRGRGGAGFPTGVKWALCAPNKSDQKYVCCNADEGDPGAFMDRSVLEGDPHAILEAMAIAGYAIGATQGYIYVRAEYPLAIKRLQIAIKQAKEYGLLGENIFGTGFDFNIDLRFGAGAFVCGEETALMTSIEGKRGEPRPRPPFPAVKGLFGKPSILNNVETYANVTQIVLNGADWFKSIGTEKSHGTKVFAVGGKIKHTGLVEVPMGTTLREIVEDICGGVPNGRQFKAAQTGGPSGGCISKENFDVQIDYDNLLAIGSMMGSGGLIVMDDTACMVDIAKFFLDFTVDESCGKCTPCRIGNKRLMEILIKITQGKATMQDLKNMEELCLYIKDNSLCGLGQTSPNPVLSTYKCFKDEYIAHVKDKKCPAGVCKDLMRYEIIPEKCKGCSACSRVCPVNAISGEIKKPFKINQDICIKCGTCMDTCKFGAIIKK